METIEEAPEVPTAIASPSILPLPVASTRRDNNFNFLRLLLASLVLLAHSPEMVDGDRHRELLTRVFHTVSFGELAVDGFFILSGYLITQSLLRSRNLRDYLKKRVLRIYPGFLVASMICSLVVGPLGAQNASDYFHQLSFKKLPLDLLLLHVPTVPPCFQGLPWPLVNGALWTIHYEFLCYLLLAILGSIGLLKAHKARLTLFLVVLAAYAASECLRGPAENLLAAGLIGKALHRAFNDPLVMLRFVAFFLAGSCFEALQDRIRFHPLYVGAAAVLLFAALFHAVTAAVALVICGAYLLFAFGFANVPALRGVGRRVDISYGVYLYGWPVQILLLWYLPLRSPWLLFASALPVALLCGFVSWNIVEKPFLRLKGRPRVDGQEPQRAAY